MAKSSPSLQLLKTAYAQLLSDHTMADITVQDITRKAQTSRSTFYRHFLDLADFQNWLREDLLSSIIAQFDMRDATEVDFTSFYRFAAANQILLQTFLKDRPWPEFVDELHAVVLQNYLHVFNQGVDGVPADVRAEFLIGGQINLFHWWISQPTPPTPELMASYHKKLSGLS